MNHNNPLHSDAMTATSPRSLIRSARWSEVPAEAWDAPRVVISTPAEHRPGLLGESALDIESQRARARLEGRV